MYLYYTHTHTTLSGEDEQFLIDEVQKTKYLIMKQN